MKKRIAPAAATLLATLNLSAATHYVDALNTNPTPPYTNWATAAINIQAAVDAATSGGEVLVTNGIYAPVVVAKSLLLRSTSGPRVTIIDAQRLSRCAWLTNGASMTGFRLMGGQADYGGGVFCTSSNVFLTNCMISYNTAFMKHTDYSGDSPPATGWGGGVCGGTLYNCLINGNTAAQGGGGALSNTLYDCTLADNSAYPTNGGGALYCELYRCQLTRNTALNGGGAFQCALYDCTVSSNSAVSLYPVYGSGAAAYGGFGGGAGSCTLSNCTVNGNIADNYGGGLGPYCGAIRCALIENYGYGYGGGAGAPSLTMFLTNCLIVSNSAWQGAGVHYGVLYNCTVVTNYSEDLWRYPPPGAVAYSQVTNSIVYYNQPTNTLWGSFAYCCTTPSPGGVGIITNAPQFVNAPAGDFRLLGTSPCINAGNNAYGVGSTDLAGNPRIVGGTVDLGAYEFQGTNPPAFYTWLTGSGITADGTTDFQDPDHDGLNNRQEWVSGTSPTDAASALRLLSATPTGTSVLVSWQSVTNTKYFLARTTNPASPFAVVATNLSGQAGQTLYTDTPSASKAYFYRVGTPSP